MRQYFAPLCPGRGYHSPEIHALRRYPIPFTPWEAVPMRILVVLLLGSLLLRAAASSLPAAESAPALLSEVGSERATTGPGNNIVTHGDRTHVVWQDSEVGGYVNRVRTLDRGTGRWSPAVTLGPGVDNHARPTIAVDSQGYLHVVLSGHNTMMVYRRSTRPNDSSEWTASSPIDLGTYPMLVCGPDDVPVVTARPKSHAGVDLHVLPRGAMKWQARPLVLKRNAKYSSYAGYNVSLKFDAAGTLHLAADVYEGKSGTRFRGIRQAIVYLRSRDLGQTWEKADGTMLGPQVDPSEAEVLAEINLPAGQGAAARLRNGGMVVDSTGRPYVYFTDGRETPGRMRLLAHDPAVGWHDLPIDEAFRSGLPGAEALGARGHLSMTSDDTLYTLIEFAPIPPPGKSYGRFERTLGVGLVVSRDRGQTFEVREVLPVDESRHYTQANLERPTGRGNLKHPPGLIVADGEQRYPKKGEVIHTRVYYLEP
jgi:hypothetical protein